MTFLVTPFTKDDVKLLALTACLIVSLGDAFPSRGQGTFQNLDFEQAQISGPPPQGVSVAQGLPHWEVSENGVPTTVMLYDAIALSQWQVSIQDNNGEAGAIISGKYSVFLQGGQDFRGTFGYGEISQIGTLAADTHSMLFAARMTRPGNLNVAFNGQPIQTGLFQDHGTYQTFGADISAFAGQTGELSFTAPDPTWTFIDDIQFSTASIPEPSTLAMITVGGLLVGTKISRQKKKVTEVNP